MCGKSIIIGALPLKITVVDQPHATSNVSKFLKMIRTTEPRFERRGNLQRRSVPSSTTTI